MIGIVDYNAGNLFSVINSLRFLGFQVRILKSPAELAGIDRLILPGVGSFGAAIANLQRSGFSDAVIEWIASGRPFLGICLGLQLLFETSEESDGIRGLSVLKGSVRKFRTNKVPQIGWNLGRVFGKSALAESLGDEYYYFVHSYYVCPEEEIALLKTEYSVEFVSGIQKDNIVAVQFHPEKSSYAGLKFLKNWVELC